MFPKKQNLAILSTAPSSVGVHHSKTRPGIHSWESSGSKMTHVKHNCARVYIILYIHRTNCKDLVYERIAQTWFINETQGWTVFLCLLWLEKIRIEHMCIRLDIPNTAWNILRHDHKNPTKEHRLKSHNLTPLLEVT